MIEFIIPIRPVAFARAGQYGKRRYTPKPQVAYRNSVKAIARHAMGCKKQMEGPVALHFTAQYQSPKTWGENRRAATVWKTSRADLDNLIKEVADSLSGIIYRDDAQVASIIAQKVYGREDSVRVQITELDE